MSISFFQLRTLDNNQSELTINGWFKSRSNA